MWINQVKANLANSTQVAIEFYWFDSFVLNNQKVLKKNNFYFVCLEQVNFEFLVAKCLFQYTFEMDRSKSLIGPVKKSSRKYFWKVKRKKFRF